MAVWKYQVTCSLSGVRAIKENVMGNLEMLKAYIQSLFIQQTLTEGQAIMLGVGSKEVEGKGQVSTSVGLIVCASGGRRDPHV